jgi:hypothetical protein
VFKALVLAARDKNYHNLSIRVALVIFCNTPNSKDEELKPESYVLQLLSTSDLGSYSPLAFMKEIPPAVESLSWEYAGISTSLRILTFLQVNEVSSRRAREAPRRKARTKFEASPIPPLRTVPL